MSGANAKGVDPEGFILTIARTCLQPSFQPLLDDVCASRSLAGGLDSSHILSGGAAQMAPVATPQISAATADPLWELSSFSEAAKAECQAMNMPAMPSPSQPRQGSTAPTCERRRGCKLAPVATPPIPPTAANPLWELSSFSEAAKAVGQANNMPAIPPPSQPRWGSTAPTC